MTLLTILILSTRCLKPFPNYISIVLRKKWYKTSQTAKKNKGKRRCTIMFIMLIGSHIIELGYRRLAWTLK